MKRVCMKRDVGSSVAADEEEEQYAYNLLERDHVLIAQ